MSFKAPQNAPEGITYYICYNYNVLLLHGFRSGVRHGSRSNPKPRLKVRLATSSP
jgi:hypothetical protein